MQTPAKAILLTMTLGLATGCAGVDDATGLEALEGSLTQLAEGVQGRDWTKVIPATRDTLATWEAALGR